ncbi:MAG: division/cell wall cluster transcriptional repressor MraZ [Planctomycetota bacterium]
MAAAFIGNSAHALDDKGRVIIPSKFRDQLSSDVDGDGFVATPAPEGCLFLYTRTEWARICQDQSALPKGSPALRQWQRLWVANAETLPIDKQGRVLLPESLRRIAKLDRDVVLAGCFDRIEVWTREGWDRAQAEASTNFPQHTQEFLSAGGAPQPREAN